MNIGWYGRAGEERVSWPSTPLICCDDDVVARNILLSTRDELKEKFFFLVWVGKEGGSVGYNGCALGSLDGLLHLFGVKGIVHLTSSDLGRRLD